MKFKIEKNIKIPKSRSEHTITHPARDMEVGDSYLAEEEYTRENMVLISNRLRNFCKKSNDCKHYKFSTRKVDGNRIRVWRIK